MRRLPVILLLLTACHAPAPAPVRSPWPDSVWTTGPDSIWLDALGLNLTADSVLGWGQYALRYDEDLADTPRIRWVYPRPGGGACGVVRAYFFIPSAQGKSFPTTDGSFRFLTILSEQRVCTPHPDSLLHAWHMLPGPENKPLRPGDTRYMDDPPRGLILASGTWEHIPLH